MCFLRWVLLGDSSGMLEAGGAASSCYDNGFSRMQRVGSQIAKAQRHRNCRAAYGCGRCALRYATP
jgi:hypothetical protein